MNTGKPRPYTTVDNEISGRLILDSTKQQYVFPALNISNNFATGDYEARINTKIDYTIYHVFKSMTVQTLNTLHTICELEKNTTTHNFSNVSIKRSISWISFNRKS